MKKLVYSLVVGLVFTTLQLSTVSAQTGAGEQLAPPGMEGDRHDGPRDGTQGDRHDGPRDGTQGDRHDGPRDGTQGDRHEIGRAHV